MIDQLARATGIVKDALKKASLGEPVGYMVAYGFVPVEIASGQMELHPGWMITVTIRSAMLDGRPDYTFPAVIPAPMQLPPDRAFEQTAIAALEAVKQLRDEGDKQ